MTNQQRLIILAKNKKRIKQLCPQITDESGIYVFARKTENERKYAYVGQAKHLLQRTAGHLTGYQHIDLSLKKRGLYDKEKNPYGWFIIAAYSCSIEDLDGTEQWAYDFYADLGFQLTYNKTAGGQGDKESTHDYGQGGYRRGVAYGRKQAIKEIATLFHKYTTGKLTPLKGKVAEKKTAELQEILEVEDVK